MVESQPSIVDAIKSNLPSHIFNHYTFARLHFIISDLHNEAIHTFIHFTYDSLRKDNGVVCMTGTICDPELLGHRRGRVNDKLLPLLVIGSCGLHLWRIVSITEFSEAEAPHMLE